MATCCLTRVVAMLAACLACIGVAHGAHAMTHTVVLHFNGEPLPSGDLVVGIIANGIASTSAPLPEPGIDGMYRVPVAIQYGAEIRAVLLHITSGNVSQQSNPRTYERCLWDRDGSGEVDLADFGSFRAEVGESTATVAESESFSRAFGMHCPER